jgi:hypothetical protein
MGGILEDIQIIGFNEINNSFILNGIFRFNIGDTINVTGKTKDFEEFGSLDNPVSYTIVKIVLDETNKLTEIFVDLDIVLTKYKGYYESETKRGKSMRFTNSGVGDPSGYTINMDGKNSIETTSSYGSITNYVYNETVKKILDVRVRVKLENKVSTENLSKLTISLKMPNGVVVSILPLSINDTTDKSLILNSKILKDSIFSISKTYNSKRNGVKSGYPFYDGIFKNSVPIID